jgi:IS1 family transposase
MNRLPIEKRVQIVNMLVEGMSMRAVSRVADVSINTVTKLLEDVGSACLEFQDKALRKLNCKRVQCDEIWSFVGCKEKNVPDELRHVFGVGDVYTWTAIDADTKLVPCWHIGTRGAESAHIFINDLADRIAHRVQLTTDGLNVYVNAVAEAFNGHIDYAMLVKTYGDTPARGAARKYSPSAFTGAHKTTVSGYPDQEHISTSYVERQNLTMRMNMRRFTRLTNGFSKKVENHMHAISLRFMHYNFARIHKTLRVTPAMEAGIADRVWTIREICELVPEPVAAKRGPYKPRQPKTATQNSN